MPPSEAELVQAQITRMKVLIESLEAECSTTKEQHDRFLALKRELAAMKERLKPFKPE
jgi:hypothetical protein